MYELKIPRPISPSAFSLALLPESLLGDLGVEHSRFMVVAGIRHYKKLLSKKRAEYLQKEKQKAGEMDTFKIFSPFIFLPIFTTENSRALSCDLPRGS